jgi:hypothetical protein
MEALYNLFALGKLKRTGFGAHFLKEHRRTPGQKGVR